MLEAMVRATCDRCGHVELTEQKLDAFGVIGFESLPDGKLLCDSCYQPFKVAESAISFLAKAYLSGDISSDDLREITEQIIIIERNIDGRQQDTIVS